jgi:hypothetical protein
MTTALPRELGSSQMSIPRERLPFSPHLSRSRSGSACSKTRVSTRTRSIDYFPFAAHVYAVPSVRRLLYPNTCKRVPALSDD